MTLRTPAASDTVTGGIRPERDWERALGVRPSASAVIFDRRGRVLLQQRSDGGQWGLPGGSVEIGESVTDAAIREVREETGLSVTRAPARRRLLRARPCRSFGILTATCGTT